jgi:hypothetical protein
MPTWSTATVPRRRQFAYWREMICEAFLDLTPESRLRDGFYGRVSQQSLERLDLARIESQAQQSTDSRSSAHVAVPARGGTGPPPQRPAKHRPCLPSRDGRSNVSKTICNTPRRARRLPAQLPTMSSA